MGRKAKQEPSNFKVVVDINIAEDVLETLIEKYVSNSLAHLAEERYNQQPHLKEDKEDGR